MVKPVLIAVLVAAAAVVLWRLIRGAHSWAQVGLFGLALLAGVFAADELFARGAALEELVPAAVAGTFYYLGYFGLRRTATESPLTKPPAHHTKRDRWLDRIQAAMLLVAIGGAVLIPVLWLLRRLVTPLDLLFAYGLFAVALIGLIYAAHRVTLEPAANPFDRRGRSFFVRAFRYVKREVRSMAGRLPLFASRRPADSAR